MKTYNGIHYCVKCGSDYASVKLKKKPKEHLLLTCGTCGHAWDEGCQDVIDVEGGIALLNKGLRAHTLGDKQDFMVKAYKLFTGDNLFLKTEVEYIT